MQSWVMWREKSFNLIETVSRIIKGYQWGSFFRLEVNLQKISVLYKKQVKRDY